MQVNFCTPQFFFNISQRFPILVLDLREVQNGYLKNSIQVWDVSESDTIEEMEKNFIYPDQQSEQIKLKQLFKNRKRNFNFIIPFDTADMFSLVIRDRVRSQESDISDQFKVPIQTLQQWCKEIEQMLPHQKHIKIRSRAQTMVIPEEDDTIETPKLQKITQSEGRTNILKKFGSSKRVLEFQEMSILNGPPVKQRSLSQPKLFGFNCCSIHENKEQFERALDIYKIMQQDKVRQLYIILHPIQLIFENHPFLNYANNRNRGFLDKTFPNEILENKIYLGGAEHAKDIEMLTDILGITHVVNATVEVNNYSDSLNYMKISIYDEPQTQIKQHFDECFQYIENALAKNGKVFVHCAQGKSRSACLVVMYLMRKFGWTFEKAYDFVKERREIVCINDGFINQLIEIQN